MFCPLCDQCPSHQGTTTSRYRTYLRGGAQTQLSPFHPRRKGKQVLLAFSITFNWKQPAVTARAFISTFLSSLKPLPGNRLLPSTSRVLRWVPWGWPHGRQPPPGLCFLSLHLLRLQDPPKRAAPGPSGSLSRASPSICWSCRPCDPVQEGDWEAPGRSEVCSWACPPTLLASFKRTTLCLKKPRRLFS